MQKNYFLRIKGQIPIAAIAATNINKGLPVALSLALAVFALSLLPAAFPASLELSGESAKAVASLDVNSP